jgi:hypothetical protein
MLALLSSSLPSSSTPSSLPLSLLKPLLSSAFHHRRRHHHPPTICQEGGLLPPSLPRLVRDRLLLPRRRSLPPRTCRPRHFHPTPRRGEAGGLHHRSGIRHPLTRSGSPTPLHPNAEERRPRKRQWDCILEWLLRWTRTQRK